MSRSELPQQPGIAPIPDFAKPVHIRKPLVEVMHEIFPQTRIEYVMDADVPTFMRFGENTTALIIPTHELDYKRRLKTYVILLAPDKPPKIAAVAVPDITKDPVWIGKNAVFGGSEALNFTTDPSTVPNQGMLGTQLNEHGQKILRYRQYHSRQPVEIMPEQVRTLEEEPQILLETATNQPEWACALPFDAKVRIEFETHALDITPYSSSNGLDMYVASLIDIAPMTRIGLDSHHFQIARGKIYYINASNQKMKNYAQKGENFVDLPLISRGNKYTLGCLLILHYDNKPHLFFVKLGSDERCLLTKER